MNVNGMQYVASTVRQAQDDRKIAAQTSTPPMGFYAPLIGCRISGQLLCGSYNVAARIQFDDGVKWLLKIPANGHHGAWNSFAADNLTSEALTIQLIKTRTSIPVPSVHSFEASENNPVGCPYILMDFMEGKPLHDLWFDGGVSAMKLEQIRTRALRTTATAMAELSQLRAPRNGALRFDQKGNPVDIGPVKRIEPPDDVNDDGFRPKGPFTDPLKALLFTLDSVNPEAHCTTYGHGIYQLLRLAAGWALKGSDIHNSAAQIFALAHPDFAVQNVLFRDDGTLSGIIDWDGVSAVPLCVSSLRYPLWLLRDWEPTSYNLNTDKDARKDSKRPVENHPEELSHYRNMYAEFMEMALTMFPSTSAISHQLAQLTRSSLVTGVIEMAANFPDLAPCVVEKILDELALLEGGFYNKNSPPTPYSRFSPSIQEYIIARKKAKAEELTDEDHITGNDTEERMGEMLTEIVKNSKENENLRNEQASADNEQESVAASHTSGEIPAISTSTPSPSSNLPTHTAEALKVKAARFALGLAEKGFRGLAGVFHQEVDVEANMNPVAESKHEKTVTESSSDLQQSQVEGESDSKPVAKSVRAAFERLLQWIENLFRKYMGIAPREEDIMSALEAQTTQDCHGDAMPQAKPESTSILEQSSIPESGPMPKSGRTTKECSTLRGESTCPKQCVEAIKPVVQDRKGKQDEKPPQFVTRDVWDRLALMMEDCGVTKTMLKNGQREATDWIIINMR